jgi:putative flavoprotein involved in K+ transport
MRQPTGQLAGRPDRANVDLVTLQAAGVRLTGRLIAAEGDRIRFSDDLSLSVSCADARLRRLLARFDSFAGFAGQYSTAEIAAVELASKPPLSLSLRGEKIGTIIWATGYRRDFSWLNISAAVRPDGELAHWEGVMPVPGLYALGFRLLRKRDSHFIGGVGSDAAAISAQIAAFLGRTSRKAA